MVWYELPLTPSLVKRGNNSFFSFAKRRAGDELETLLQ